MEKALIFAALFLVLVGVGYSVFSSEIACAIADGCGGVGTQAISGSGDGTWTLPFSPASPSCTEQCGFFEKPARDAAIEGALAEARAACQSATATHPGNCPSQCPVEWTRKRCDSPTEGSTTGARDGTSCVCTVTASCSGTAYFGCSKPTTNKGVPIGNAVAPAEAVPA
ncbi:MAG: hypothetical protein ABH864_05445 [archaeon]